MTVPSGGTSDYAPEMIHAAARGEPYACFVRPDTRIPFMAMPDAIDALLALAAAPRERLTRTAYNVRRVQSHGPGDPRRGRRGVSAGVDHLGDRRASGRPSSIRGRRTWMTARRGATGASRRRTIFSGRSTTI